MIAWEDAVSGRRRRHRARRNPKMSAGATVALVAVAGAAVVGGYFLYKNSQASSGGGALPSSGSTHQVGTGVYPIAAHAGDTIVMTVPGTNNGAPTVVPSGAITLTGTSVNNGNTVYTFSVSGSGVIYAPPMLAGIPTTIATVTVS